jgi:hypothetical protein
MHLGIITTTTNVAKGVYVHGLIDDAHSSLTAAKKHSLFT